MVKNSELMKSDSHSKVLRSKSRRIGGGDYRMVALPEERKRGAAKTLARAKNVATPAACNATRSKAG